QLGRWMDEEGVELGKLDVAAIKMFRAARRAGGDRRVASVGELRQLVRYLREGGGMAAGDCPWAPTPTEGLLAAARQRLPAGRVGEGSRRRAARAVALPARARPDGVGAGGVGAAGGGLARDGRPADDRPRRGRAAAGRLRPLAPGRGARLRDPELAGAAWVAL